VETPQRSLPNSLLPLQHVNHRFNQPDNHLFNRRANQQ
jgi:hypothetical protein